MMGAACLVYIRVSDYFLCMSLLDLDGIEKVIVRSILCVNGSRSWMGASIGAVLDALFPRCRLFFAGYGRPEIL